MDWQQVSFPEDVDPFDEPMTLIREVEAIYQKLGSPKGFCLYQEINYESSCVLYFSPEAALHCRQEGLSKTYRNIHPCNKPAPSGKPIITVVGDDNLCQLTLLSSL